MPPPLPAIRGNCSTTFSGRWVFRLLWGWLKVAVLCHHPSFLLRRVPCLYLRHNAPEDFCVVCAIRRAADVVKYHEIIRMVFLVFSCPIGYKRRLAGTRLTQHHQRQACRGNVFVQPLKICLPANIDLCRATANASWSHPFTFKGGRNSFQGEFLSMTIHRSSSTSFPSFFGSA